MFAISALVVQAQDMQLPTLFGEPTTSDKCDSEACRGEEFVVYLMLAVIYSYLEVDEAARSCVARAQKIVQCLSRDRRTVREPRTLKFLRIYSKMDDLTTLVHIPFVGEALVLPDTSLCNLTPAESVAQAGTMVEHYRDIEIVYFGFRLRTHQALAALSVLNPADELSEVARVAHGIVDQSIHAEIYSITPLDRLWDYFTLADSLLDQGNVSLARLALQKADSILGSYSTSQKLRDEAMACRELQVRLKSLLKRLAAKASYGSKPMSNRTCKH